jgi:hypothetical protein
MSAEADALDVVVATPFLPVVSQVSASPWGASASLNSVGQSMADAGAPYSPFVYSLPGTVGGLGAGLVPPIPQPPGYVSAAYPTRTSASQTQAGYQLSAVTTESDAKGEVNLGAEQPGAGHANLFALAETTANADGSVTANARAGVDLLNLGGLADIGNLSSTEQIIQQANQAPQIKGSTSLGTITLLSLPTGLSGSTGQLLGVGLPIPISGAILGALNQVLAPGGVSLTYLPQTFTYTDGTQSTGARSDSSKMVQSVDSGALQVTVTQKLSGEPVTTTVTLGRVYLSATDTPGLSPGVSQTGPDTNAGAGSAPATGTSAGNLPAAPPGTAPGLASPALAPASAPSLASTPPTSGSGTSQAAAPTVGRVTRTGPSGESLYLLLVLAGAAALGGSQLIRLVSVRLALSSPK